MKVVWKTLPLALVLVAGACDNSKAELQKTLAQVQQISAEKDSLLKDVMSTSQFIADVNTELNRVKSRTTKLVKGGPGELESNMTPAQQREAIKTRIKELTDRLNESESRLAASRSRVQQMTTNNAAMAKQLAAYDSTIAAFKTIIDNQKSEIASLQQQVGALQTENTQLKTENVQLVTAKTELTKEKDALTTEKNTVYYVIGRADDLIKKHILDKQGGFLGFGKTQVPARDLNPGDFTAIDRTAVSEIAFPSAQKTYRIVTRQDVAALETAPDKDGRLRGGLKIKDAERFWSASKFLIVVEQ